MISQLVQRATSKSKFRTLNSAGTTLSAGGRGDFRQKMVWVFFVVCLFVCFFSSRLEEAAF